MQLCHTKKDNIKNTTPLPSILLSFETFLIISRNIVGRFILFHKLARLNYMIMKKSLVLSFIVLFTVVGLNAQYYQIHPSFISFTGGAGNISFLDSEFPGYYGKLEGAYYFNYIFGIGLQANHGFHKPFPNKFADERVNTPRFNYTKTTADLSNYVVENYTFNAYLTAMPDWRYSFTFVGGAGLQRLNTPKGSILYEEIYPYQFYGNPVQSATLDFAKETYTSFVFHTGARANLMITDRFGLTLNADYFFAKNKKYENERLHEFSATLGIVIGLHEILN